MFFSEIEAQKNLNNIPFKRNLSTSKLLLFFYQKDPTDSHPSFSCYFLSFQFERLKNKINEI